MISVISVTVFSQLLHMFFFMLSLVDDNIFFYNTPKAKIFAKVFSEYYQDYRWANKRGGPIEPKARQLPR